MSDKRRLMRTQGRFTSAPSESCETKQKEISEENSRQTKVKCGNSKDLNEMEIQDNREIDKETDKSAGGSSKSGTEWRNVIGVQGDTCKMLYEENCFYPVPQLNPARHHPEEIKEHGMKVLSTTSFGESRVAYYPGFLNIVEAFEYYDKFTQNILWRQMNVIIHGKPYPQPRLVSWFGPFPYAYSGVLLEPQEMPADILKIKEKIENFLAKDNINVNFNSVLLNQYRHGNDSVAWHSDDEISMGIDPTIASISLGDVRKFEMRRKPVQSETYTPVEYFVNMKNGSLLIMDGVMQKDWQHRVPKEFDRAPRINLTFRTVCKDERLLKAINK